MSNLNPAVSWLAPKCAVREIHPGFNGIFAIAPIAKGELLSIWSGEIMTRAQVQQLPEKYQHYATQIEEEFYLAGVMDDPADYFNHSCNPNAGMQGQIVLVAMRDIQPDEQICFDYAMTDGSDYDEFECRCGAENCRRVVRGSDWQNPELWERYAGFFVPYLQKRIDRLRAEQKKQQPDA